MIIQANCAALTVLLVLLAAPATAQQPPEQQYKLTGGKTVAVILLMLVVLFFILGFISLFSRQCADRGLRMRSPLDLRIFSVGGGSRRRELGLDRAVVDSFPTFAYSAVKDTTAWRSALECAVCLGEFRDDETLRLIPHCCHVFHPNCIDVWLSTHSTCPVCRANLAPKSGDTSPSLAVHIGEQPDPDELHRVGPVNEGPRRTNNLEGEICALPVYNSTGHSPVRAGENLERFTLRLTEEARERLLGGGGLSRTKSIGVRLEKQRSERRGFRTRSMGRSEVFGLMTWTPPFVGRSMMERHVSSTVGVDDDVEVGERSVDLLFPQNHKLST